MEIILRQDIEQLGSHGEVINVKSGYARNFLLPQGMAVIATKGAKAQIERERVRKEKLDAKHRQELLDLAKQLERTSCTIAAQANEAGSLFGSVTVKDIVESIGQAGIQLDPEQVILEDPIKEIGVYGFTIRLLQDIEVTSKVWVVKE